MLKTTTKFSIFFVFAAVLGLGGVYAQAKPAIVVLNKADNDMAIVDPATM